MIEVKERRRGAFALDYSFTKYKLSDHLGENYGEVNVVSIKHYGVQQGKYSYAQAKMTKVTYIDLFVCLARQ